MSGRRTRKKEVVQIDADWLLGESTTPAVRDYAWFRRSVIALIGISIAVWSWPYASKQWLRWELDQLQAQDTIGSADEVLPTFLALNPLQPAPTATTTKLPLELPKGTIATAFTTPIPVVSIPELTASTNAAAPIFARTRISDSEPASKAIPDPPSIRILAGGPTIDTFPTKTTAVASSSNGSLAIPRVVAKIMTVSPPAAPSQQPESLATESLATESPPVVLRLSDAPETVALRGIEKRSLEELLPLLASTQPKIFQQTANELLRRGLPRNQLDLVVGLAQGDPVQKLQIMERLVKEADFDEIPWLVWMAEGKDPTVRQKAIALLGSMSDPTARRKLRMLKDREPDGLIADQINQVLLASGNAANSLR